LKEGEEEGRGEERKEKYAAGQAKNRKKEKREGCLSVRSWGKKRRRNCCIHLGKGGDEDYFQPKEEEKRRKGKRGGKLDAWPKSR